MHILKKEKCQGTNSKQETIWVSLNVTSSSKKVKALDICIKILYENNTTIIILYYNQINEIH